MGLAPKIPSPLGIPLLDLDSWRQLAPVTERNLDTEIHPNQVGLTVPQTLSIYHRISPKTCDRRR